MSLTEIQKDDIIRNGQTRLMIAVKYNDLKEAERLIKEEGAAVNEKVNGRNALWFAAYYTNVPAFELLLKNGASTAQQEGNVRDYINTSIRMLETPKGQELPNADDYIRAYKQMLEAIDVREKSIEDKLKRGPIFTIPRPVSPGFKTK